MIIIIIIIIIIDDDKVGSRRCSMIPLPPLSCQPSMIFIIMDNPGGGGHARATLTFHEYKKAVKERKKRGDGQQTTKLCAREFGTFKIHNTMFPQSMPFVLIIIHSCKMPSHKTNVNLSVAQHLRGCYINKKLPL